MEAKWKPLAASARSHNPKHSASPFDVTHFRCSYSADSPIGAIINIIPNRIRVAQLLVGCKIKWENGRGTGIETPVSDLEKCRILQVPNRTAILTTVGLTAPKIRDA